MMLAVACMKSDDVYVGLLPRESFDKRDAFSLIAGDSFNSQDYSVTKEMVAEFILAEQGKKAYSIMPYPSEDRVLLYVVNFDEGWELFPGDSRFGLLLAKGGTGNMELSKISDNPGLCLWIEDYMNQIENARNMEIVGDRASKSVRIWELFRKLSTRENIIEDTSKLGGQGTRDMWAKIKLNSTISNDTLGYKAPLIQTKWGQQYPWNINMPVVNNTDTCRTGCPAVALAQILYYFHCQQNMPTGMYDSINIATTSPYICNNRTYYTITVNRSSFTYNSTRWDNLPLSKDSGTLAGYSIVSELMLDIGARLGLHYSPLDTHIDVSSLNNYYYDTSPCNVSGTWEQYSYQTTFGTVTNSLDLNIPVLVGGLSPNGNGGHTWIIDGYLHYVRAVTNRFEWWPVSMIPSGTAVFGYKDFYDLLAQYGTVYPGMQEIEYLPLEIELYSMNWGFDGVYDGDYVSIMPDDIQWKGLTSNVVVQHHLVASEFIAN